MRWSLVCQEAEQDVGLAGAARAAVREEVRGEIEEGNTDKLPDLLA